METFSDVCFVFSPKYSRVNSLKKKWFLLFLHKIHFIFSVYKQSLFQIRALTATTSTLIKDKLGLTCYNTHKMTQFPSGPQITYFRTVKKIIKCVLLQFLGTSASSSGLPSAGETPGTAPEAPEEGHGNRAVV